MNALYNLYAGNAYLCRKLGFNDKGVGIKKTESWNICHKRATTSS